METDQLETCPYDPSHRILPGRMPFHLFKCEQNHISRTDKKKCPFNATHIVDEIHYEHHIATCPARQSLIHYKYREPENELNIVPIPIPNSKNEVGDEDWDAEPAVKAYDPMVATQNKPILRNFMGLSKSRKKQMRFEHRQKVQDLEYELERTKPSTGSSLRKPKTEHNNEQLRRPQNTVDSKSNNSSSESNIESQDISHGPSINKSLADDLKYHKVADQKIKVEAESPMKLRRPHTSVNLDMSKLSLNDDIASSVNGKTEPHQHVKKPDAAVKENNKHIVAQTQESEKPTTGQLNNEPNSTQENEWCKKTSRKKKSRKMSNNDSNKTTSSEESLKTSTNNYQTGSATQQKKNTVMDNKLDESLASWSKTVRSCLDKEQKFYEKSAALDKKIEGLQNKKTVPGAMMKQIDSEFNARMTASNSSDAPLPKIGGRGVAQAYKTSGSVSILNSARLPTKKATAVKSDIK